MAEVYFWGLVGGGEEGGPDAHPLHLQVGGRREGGGKGGRGGGNWRKEEDGRKEGCEQGKGEGGHGRRKGLGRMEGGGGMEGGKRGCVVVGLSGVGRGGKWWKGG